MHLLLDGHDPISDHVLSLLFNFLRDFYGHLERIARSLPLHDFVGDGDVDLLRLVVG